MKAYIFYGGWEGHDPKPFSDIIASWLKEHNFEIIIDDNLNRLDSLEDLLTFDVIVPIWTMGEMTLKQEENLVKAVEHGVGLAGFHGGMGDAFRNSNFYQFVVGGQFVNHPNEAIDFDIEIADPSDPILKDIKPFKVNAEQYYMHLDPSIDVLLYTTLTGNEYTEVDVKGIKMPVCWKRNYGKGRVFYLSVGHKVKEFKNENIVKIMTQGLLWASKY